MNEQTVELLTRARAKIENEKNWHHMAWAKESGWFGYDFGIHDVTNPKATRFCALGALYNAAGSVYLTNRDAEYLLRRACRELYHDSVISVNSGWFGHKRILKAYDRAIELAREAIL